MKNTRLIYTSEATKPFNTRDLLNLLHASRSYNSIDGICGFLYYKNGIFLQVIEGESEMITNLFYRIQKDKRHNNIKIISSTSINDFLFSNWSMGCIAFNEPKLSLIPGLSGELHSKENINLLVEHLPQISSFLNTNPELNLAFENKDKI